MSSLFNQQRFKWCLYDWAGSAFSTVVNSFVLSAYFSQTVAVNPITGTTLWGYATAMAAAIVAIVSPLLGTLVDQKGRIGVWFSALNITTITTIAAWWWVTPGSRGTQLALLLCLIGNVCFECAFVLYNSMLKRIAPANKLGTLSGIGYALGYAGGAFCLVLILSILITNTFGITLFSNTSDAIRFVGPFTAIWFAVFSLPLLLDIPATSTSYNKKNNFKSIIQHFAQRCKTLPQHPQLFLFLIARLFFIDGLNTIFTFAGIYAAGTFNMTTQQIIVVGLSSQAGAFTGAILFGLLDDRLGPMKCLKIALSWLTLMVLGLAFAVNQTQFWLFAIGLSLTIGPIQSCCRSYLARISPPKWINQNFGFFAFSGKITAFLGPSLVAVTISATHLQRTGIIPIAIMVAIGLVILTRCPNSSPET